LLYLNIALSVLFICRILVKKRASGRQIFKNQVSIKYIFICYVCLPCSLLLVLPKINPTLHGVFQVYYLSNSFSPGLVFTDVITHKPSRESWIPWSFLEMIISLISVFHDSC
jgi:hypothetical protein